MVRRLLVPLVLGIAVLTGCGASRQEEDTSLPPSERTTSIMVDNRNFFDMTIYVLDGGQRVRLGIASSNSTTELIIPSQVVRGAGSLQFLCDPIGSDRAPVSDEIMVQPGDHVKLLIPGS